MTIPTKAEAQKARDAWTKLIGATVKKAPSLAQPALDALPILEAFGKSKLAVQPPPVESDSPDGTTIVPGGATITQAGVRWRIGTDKKLYRNDVVQPWSGGVDLAFLLNSKLYQHADWGTGNAFFEAKEGAAAISDPRAPVVVDPPPVDPGQTGTPVGDTVTDKNGDVFGRTADGKLTKNGLVQVWSSNVIGVFVLNGDAWQIAQVPAGVRYYLAKEGDAGQSNDPRVVVDPGTLPPVPKVALPAGLTDFSKMTLAHEPWTDKDINCSDWQNGITPFDPQLPQIKDGALILRQTKTRSSSIQFGDKYKGRKISFKSFVTFTLQDGLCGAVNWLFSDANNKSEADMEVCGLRGLELRLHHFRQDGNIGDSFHKSVPGIDFGRPHLYETIYAIGESVEWKVDDVSVAKVRPQDLTNPQAFPDLPMKPWIDNWATGWYDNQGNQRDGWCGYWTPGDNNMFVHGFAVRIDQAA